MFFPKFEVKKFKNNTKNNISLSDPSRKMLFLLESNKKGGLSDLLFEIGAAKVGFPSQKHTFYCEKNVFFPKFEVKN